MAVVQFVAGRHETSLDEQLAGLRVARDRYHALADRVREEFSTVDLPLIAWGQERAVRSIAQAYEKSIANMTAKAAMRGEEIQPQPQAASASVEIPRWLLLVLCAAAIFGCTVGLVAMTHSPARGKTSDNSLPVPLVTIPVAAPRLAIPINPAPPHVVSDAGQTNVAARPDAAIAPGIEARVYPHHRVSRSAAHRPAGHAVLHKKISRTRKHQSLRPQASNPL